MILQNRFLGHPKNTVDIRPGRDRFAATKLEAVMKETIAKYTGFADAVGDPELKLLECIQDDVKCKV